MIPVEAIEREIFSAVLCFAEISTDNPNVLYEIGFASACGKDIVHVCSINDRPNGFPFDIRHKKIYYKTNSPGDFERLRKEITKTIKGYLQNPKLKPKSHIADDINLNKYLHNAASYGVAITIPDDGEQLENPVTVHGTFIAEPPSGLFFCIGYNSQLYTYWPKNEIIFDYIKKEMIFFWS